jgi:hypothetical protein
MAPELPDGVGPWGARHGGSGCAKQKAEKAHFLAGVWLTWTAIAILSYARHYFEGTHPIAWPAGSWPDLLSWLACFYRWALLTPAIFRLEERFPLARTGGSESLGFFFCQLDLFLSGVANGNCSGLWRQLPVRETHFDRRLSLAFSPVHVLF